MFLSPTYSFVEGGFDHRSEDTEAASCIIFFNIKIQIFPWQWFLNQRRNTGKSISLSIDYCTVVLHVNWIDKQMVLTYWNYPMGPGDPLSVDRGQDP